MIRTALLLLRPLLRAADWAPLAWAAATALGLLGATALVSGTVVTCDALVLLRLSAAVLGAAAGFCLVDPMAYGTLPLPVPRWLRMWMRTALAAGAALTAWCAALAIMIVSLPKGSSLLIGDVSLEAGTCVLAGLSGAAVAVRLRPAHGRTAALVGAAAQLALLVLTLFLTADLWMWPLQSDPRWPGAHRIWTAVLPLPLVALAVANRGLPGRAKPAFGKFAAAKASSFKFSPKDSMLAPSSSLSCTETTGDR